MSDQNSVDGGQVAADVRVEALAPRFLTKELIARAIKIVRTGLEDVESVESDMGCFIVVIPVKKIDNPNEEDGWQMSATSYEFWIGDRDDWPLPYNEIALSKATQLWYDQNDNRTNIMPHLLFRGDTTRWGGVKRDGIVVAYSGDKSHLDKMRAEMVASAIIGLAYDAWDTSDDKKNNELFLT